MPVDQKIAVGSVFVLAHPRLHHRRISQSREAHAHIFLHDFGFRSRRQTRLRVGIDALSVMIERNLQPAALNVRHSVVLIFLKQPCWQGRWRESRVSRRHAKKEDFLPARENSLSKNLGKHFAEPGSASKYKLSGRNRFSVAASDARETPSSARRLNQRNPKLDSQLDSIFDDRSHRSPRHQYAALRLQKSPRHVFKRNLRIPPL